MSDVFRGKPLDFWLEARTTGDEETRWSAIDAIRHLCPPSRSIPLMLDTLHGDKYWRARALAAHAIYDIAFDTPSLELLQNAVPQLAAVADADPSPEVREQLHELLTLLQNAADS